MRGCTVLITLREVYNLYKVTVVQGICNVLKADQAYIKKNGNALETDGITIRLQFVSDADLFTIKITTGYLKYWLSLNFCERKGHDAMFIAWCFVLSHMFNPRLVQVFREI